MRDQNPNPLVGWIVECSQNEVANPPSWPKADQIGCCGDGDECAALHEAQRDPSQMRASQPGMHRASRMPRLAGLDAKSFAMAACNLEARTADEGAAPSVVGGCGRPPSGTPPAELPVPPSPPAIPPAARQTRA